MEVAESEEDGLDLWIFVLNLFFGELSESSLDVLFDTLWWLIGELDRSLKETDWNGLVGIRGDEESETWVRSLSGESIKLLLKIKQEAWHEMNVLKHDPVTIFMTNIKFVHGNNILSLTKGNSVKHLHWVDSLLSGECLDSQYWVGTRGQDEVDWGGGG